MPYICLKIKIKIKIKIYGGGQIIHYLYSSVNYKFAGCKKIIFLKEVISFKTSIS